MPFFDKMYDFMCDLSVCVCVWCVRVCARLQHIENTFRPWVKFNYYHLVPCRRLAPRKS